jgi:hypothetical protein
MQSYKTNYGNLILANIDELLQWLKDRDLDCWIDKNDFGVSIHMNDTSPIQVFIKITYRFNNRPLYRMGHRLTDEFIALLVKMERRRKINLI